MIPFDTGLMSIDAHNYTRTSREGYVADIDYDTLPTLERHRTPTDADSYEHYTRLHPGLYKHTIDGKDYALMLHDSYLKGDELIVKNSSDIFGIVGVKKVPLTPYLLHRGYEVDEQGVRLDHTCNDHLDMLVVNGKSTLIMDRNETEQYFTHPAEIKSASMVRASVTNTSGQTKEYLLNLKTYLKSIQTYSGNYIHDRLFLNSKQNRATFEHKIGLIRLTGYENYEAINDLTNEGMLTVSLPIQGLKPGSAILCSHYISTTEEFILSTPGYNNGVAASSTEPKVYFRTNRLLADDLESFRIKIVHEAEMGHPVTLLYEYSEPQYKSIILDDYYINLYFNTSWIKLGLSNGKELIPDKQNDDFIIELPEEVEPLSEDAGIGAMYFYKHFRDWRE